MILNPQTKLVFKNACDQPLNWSECVGWEEGGWDSQKTIRQMSGENKNVVFNVTKEKYNPGQIKNQQN